MVYKLYSAALGDAVASLEFRGEGIITAIWGHGEADLDADGELWAMELSFGSTSQMVSNDSTAAVWSMRHRIFVGAAGQTAGSEHGGLSNIRVPYQAGERIFMHVSATGPAAGNWTIYLYCEETGQQRPAVRRR